MGGLISKTMQDFGDMETPMAESFLENVETPTPLRKVGCVVFDPRSPTLNIDRTPILVKADKEECPPEVPADPRSPSVGITRTPVLQCFQPTETSEKEDKGIVQTLNFPELDSLSLSNIEEDDVSVIETSSNLETKSVEELIDFSSSSVTASTPTKTSTKIANKDKENSIVKTHSPSSLTPAKRVPFGDVNRPLAASPRFALQNKQKLILRAEIQRSSMKID